MKFIDYFSFYEIVKTLASLRVKDAAARHQYQLYWSRLQIEGTADGADSSPASRIPSAVSALLPPRRQWRRGSKDSRQKCGAAKATALSIVRIVTGLAKAGRLESSEWGQRLQRLHSRLLDLVAAPEIHLHKPTVKLIRKGTGRIDVMKAEKKKTAYRCLAKFDNLEDRILIGKTATYMRDLFDSELLDCCYAFRRNGRTYSFRAAVERLIDYRKKHSDQTLYVADCDIQKFFDVINHDVIRNAYDSFVSRVGGKCPDPIAGKVLDAYLEVYSFPAILDECQEESVVERRDCVARVSDDVLRRLYPDGQEMPRIGIPQGGALSPLLANIVMDAVDRAVLSDPDPNLFYARFCDDMIIVHPDKRKCAAALHRYLEAVALLKLPVHKVSRKTRYSASYFTEKSKGPIAWKKTRLGLPGTKWVNFLGHQIRYDGEVRVRKETIRKHQDRLQLEKTALLQNLKRAKGRYRDGVNWKDLLMVFKLRLAAIGVGRLDRSVDAPHSRSWLSVFARNLSPDGPARSQLRSLDKSRDGVVTATRRILKSAWWNLPSIGSSNGQTIDVSDEKARKKNKTKCKYFGAPFSYYGSLRKYSRPSLRDRESADIMPSDISHYSQMG